MHPDKRRKSYHVKAAMAAENLDAFSRKQSKFVDKLGLSGLPGAPKDLPFYGTIYRNQNHKEP